MTAAVIYRLGVSRSQVADDGTVIHVLRGDDVMEIEIPEDGSEFISTLWLSTNDGVMLLRLPMGIAPGMQDPAL